MKTNSSANEQATPAAVSATKPAHMPSAGAMRAAKALIPTSDPFPPYRYRSAFQIDHDILSAAQIIDRETAHAELLDLLHVIGESDVQPGHVAYLSKARIAELARAALARATHVSGEATPKAQA